ncbi:MAG TPA: dimethylmenaquinone methyltransferase [Bryobacteraceae bacterium]|jgi:regulator of RNase E activity RraA
MRSIVRAALLLTPLLAGAQVFTLTPQQLIDYTSKNPFERFADGRPKVPQRFMDRAQAMSAEEVWSILPGKGFRNQYEGNFQVLHPGKKLIGRAFTVQFMPSRPDVDDVLQDRAKQNGLTRWGNQAALDQLQPGDVLVVDLFGKDEEGTIVGDNLFYYTLKATHAGGLVVDGSIRDLEGISEMDMPAYYRHAHPTPIRNVMLTGVNIPVRIGGVTVMPGDMVFGDREGVYFIPPQFVEEVLDNADKVHVHDEWTRKKFDEGKYKSSDIYPTPHDPALKREYEEYLKMRLAQIRGK